MKTIAFLQPGWADWEAGFVLAFLREELKAQIRVATPDGAAQTSIGGLSVRADAAFADAGPDDADIFLVIGSEAWAGYSDERFFATLRQGLEADKVVGCICAGTVAAARAGLFEGRAHTSNGREWLAANAPRYAGAEGYVESARAITDGTLVSAAGAAPGTFAAAILDLAAPGRALGGRAAAMMAAEWR